MSSMVRNFKMTSSDFVRLRGRLRRATSSFTSWLRWELSLKLRLASDDLIRFIPQSGRIHPDIVCSLQHLAFKSTCQRFTNHRRIVDSVLVHTMEGSTTSGLVQQENGNTITP